MNSLQDILEYDIFRADKKTIDVERIIMRLWENRNNNEGIKLISEALSYFIDEKSVFGDIEFYLPQVAHLIIHLDQNSVDFPLQKLAVLISKTSIHAALQLSFMLSSAMEDYQPEVFDGKINTFGNQNLFKRCAKLLQDVERAVIYGNEAPLKPATIVPQVSKTLRTINHVVDPFGNGKLNGTLFYKRNMRKSNFHTKPWKPRYFVVDQRVLLCFREVQSADPLRAILLTNCRLVISETHPKYGDCCFELISDSTNTRYLLRTENADQRKIWTDAISSEINGAPPAELDENTVPIRENEISSTKSICPDEMNSNQRKRFLFFKQLKLFIINMTNICERLRFKDRSVRKFFLKHDLNELIIPPFAYLPLCSSLDRFNVILQTVSKESHAFSTKARVPALMIFELERHQSCDVATFLGSELEKYNEIDIVVPKMELVKDYKDTLEIDEVEENSAGNIHDGETKCSKFSSRHTVSSGWSPEGTGRHRLEQKGYRLGSIEPSSSHLSEKTIVEPENVIGSNGAGVLGETFEEKALRLKENSPFGNLPRWNLDGLIAKSNDDVRQEVFIMQLIAYYKRAFDEEQLPLWLHTYQILSTSKSTGLIELIPNAISIDGLKKKADFPGSLRAWYEKSFDFKEGGSAEENVRFEQAMESYVSSMAAYGVVTYLLAIKDRHNGNIMIDKDGHIVHIDFGFVFGLAPGKAFSMEKAPWKLNKEMVAVMGGRSSKWFGEYRKRCVQAMLTARKHSRQVMSLMEIMQYQSNYPAFRYNPNAISDFRSRLYVDAPETAITDIVERLIGRSYKHSGTDLYDSFQLATNGIAK